MTHPNAFTNHIWSGKHYNYFSDFDKNRSREGSVGLFIKYFHNYPSFAARRGICRIGRWQKANWNIPFSIKITTQNRIQNLTANRLYFTSCQIKELGIFSEINFCCIRSNSAITSPIVFIRLLLEWFNIWCIKQ